MTATSVFVTQNVSPPQTACTQKSPVSEPLQALAQPESLSLSNELFIEKAFGKSTAKPVLQALKATK